jgi:hypothetical protein
MSEDEVGDVVNTISNDPQAGVVIRGTGGARKLRVAGRGKGKSGGYRVVTYYAGVDIPVFLLAVFGKGDRDNLSKGERNELKRELADMAADYRRSVFAKASGRGRRTLR